MICCWLLESTNETVALKSLPSDFPTVMLGASNVDPVEKAGSIWKRSSRKNSFVRLVTASEARLARSSRAAFETDSSEDVGAGPIGPPATEVEGTSPVAMSETIWASESCGSDENRVDNRAAVPVRPNVTWYLLIVPLASISKNGSIRIGFEKRMRPDVRSYR